MQQDANRITGLVAAPFTPMHEDGSLNLRVVKPYAEGLRRNGIEAAFVGGTTGEFASLTLEERLDLTAAWVSAAPAGLKVIAHVGHTCLADARVMVAHAEKVGADAVAALSPYFFIPSSPDGLVQFLESVSSAAPSLPFYYYHMPSMTHVQFKASEFLESAADHFPTLAGVKFTHNDIQDFGNCVSLRSGRFNMLFGRDEILLDGLSIGAHGAVGSTYNFAAPLNLRILQAFRSGNLLEARRLQTLSTNVINFLVTRDIPFLSIAKALMKEVGLDCGPTRLPLPKMDRASLNAVRKGLDDLGFFDHASRMDSAPATTPGVSK